MEWQGEEEKRKEMTMPTMKQQTFFFSLSNCQNGDRNGGQERERALHKICVRRPCEKDGRHVSAVMGACFFSLIA